MCVCVGMSHDYTAERHESFVFLICRILFRFALYFLLISLLHSLFDLLSHNMFVVVVVVGMDATAFELLDCMFGSARGFFRHDLHVVGVYIC